MLFIDPMFRTGALDYARARAAAGACATYNFVFALESKLYGGTLPWHNAEIPYVFHNADYLEPSYIPGVTEQLQDIVCGAWCAFAEKGDPNQVMMPEWKPYTTDDHATMIFDTEVYGVSGHDEDLMAVLNEVQPQLTPVNRSKASKSFGGGPRV